MKVVGKIACVVMWYATLAIAYQEYGWSGVGLVFAASCLIGIAAA